MHSGMTVMNPTKPQAHGGFTLVELPAVSDAKRPGAPGFTLVELLVVVSIIVILLAMLMPAVNKAIYQAQLTACGAKLKAVGNAVTGYTFENKRHYPYRGLDRIAPGTAEVGWINAMALARPQHGYDLRPRHSKFMDINSMLQCPLSENIDLMDTKLPGAPTEDASVEASYVMFWDWQYFSVNGNAVQTAQGNKIVSGKRMARMGDEFSWGNDRYKVLAGDIDLRYPGQGESPLNDGGAGNSSQSSHPDRTPSILFPVKATGDVIFTARSYVSRWAAASPARGMLDTNFAFGDNSVNRYNDVPNWDGVWQVSKDKAKRFGLVPIQYDSQRDVDRFQIPRQ